jgi:hypothetical protein
MSTWSFVLGLVGTVTGVAGSVLGLLNHLRDRPRVVVTVDWDLVEDPKHGGVLFLEHLVDNVPANAQRFARFAVTNLGRRPVFITQVALDLGEKKYRIIKDSMPGQKLGEGDPPIVHVSPYRDLGDLSASDWKDVRAFASDSARKEYYSKPLTSKDLPSWAKRDNISVGGAN